MLTATAENTCNRRYLRIPSICAMMDGASPKYVEDLIKSHRLRAYKPTRKMTLVLLEDVIAFIESHEIRPGASPEGETAVAS